MYTNACAADLLSQAAWSGKKGEEWHAEREHLLLLRGALNTSIKGQMSDDLHSRATEHCKTIDIIHFHQARCWCSR